MADDLTFHPGDSDNAVLRKILSKLNAGLSLVGNGELPFGIEVVAVANFPVLQQIYGNVGVTNFPAGLNVNNFPSGFDVNNFPVTQAVSGTVGVNNFPVTQPVSGTVGVNNFPATQPVSGSVTAAVSNFPATQPISGTVGVNNFPATQPVSAASLPLPSGAATESTLATLVPEPEFHSSYYGTISGKTARTYKVLGRRVAFNSNSVLQDVAEFLAGTTDLLPELAGTEPLEVVSSSANDVAVTGSGTRTIKITYIDPITQAITTTANINLNGTTPVSLGATRMLFVLWMEATSGGAAEISAGNIDLRTVAGSVVQERITAGGNRSLSCRFMVPLGYTAYIDDWQVFAIGTSMDVRLRATRQTHDRSLGTRYIFQDIGYLAAGTSLDTDTPYLKYPALSKIKISTIAGATGATNRIDANFCITLIAD